MPNPREEILSRACELYLEEGLDGFSMRKLAEAVGVTAPALYRHYESKEALLADLVGEAYRRLGRALYTALEGGDALDRFLRAGRAYVRFAVEQPRMYEMLYAYPQFLGMGELPEETAAQACAIGQFWNDRVRECQDAGLLRPEETPDEIAVTLWGHAHGLISLHLRGMLGAADPAGEAEAGEPRAEGPGAEGPETEDFRTLFGASSRRVLLGLGTPALAAALESIVPGEGDPEAGPAADEAVADRPETAPSGRA